MSATWNTKYGTRRVKQNPPTLAEAIAAAQGLTDDVQGQIEIAAELMGESVEAVKSEMRKLMPDRRTTRVVTAATARDKAPRTVVVERKQSRRVATRPTSPARTV